MTKSIIDPSILAEARTLYAQGLPVADILRRTGLTTGTFYYWLDRPDGKPDPAGEADPPPPARRRETLAITGRASPQRRAQLVARIWRAADRQVLDIEQRLERLGLEGAEPDPSGRDARTLAVLARIVRELSAIDAANATATRARKQGTEHDDDPPRNLDEFRAELARRLDRLRQQRGDGGPAGNVQDR